MENEPICRAWKAYRLSGKDPPQSAAPPPAQTSRILFLCALLSSLLPLNTACNSHFWDRSGLWPLLLLKTLHPQLMEPLLGSKESLNPQGCHLLPHGSRCLSRHQITSHHSLLLSTQSLPFWPISPQSFFNPTFLPRVSLYLISFIFPLPHTHPLLFTSRLIHAPFPPS